MRILSKGARDNPVTVVCATCIFLAVMGGFTTFLLMLNMGISLVMGAVVGFLSALIMPSAFVFGGAMLLLTLWRNQL